MARDPKDLAQARASLLGDLSRAINEAPDFEAVMRIGGPILDELMAVSSSVAGYQGDPREVLSEAAGSSRTAAEVAASIDDTMRTVGAMSGEEAQEYREAKRQELRDLTGNYERQKRLLIDQRWLAEMRLHHLAMADRLDKGK